MSSVPMNTAASKGAFTFLDLADPLLVIFLEFFKFPKGVLDLGALFFKFRTFSVKLSDEVFHRYFLAANGLFGPFYHFTGHPELAGYEKGVASSRDPREYFVGRG